MKKKWRHYIEASLSAWISVVERFDKLILLLACLSMAWCAYYTVHHLEMNTSTEDMLSPDLEWRRLDLEIDARFPQDTNNLLVVVEATTPDAAAYRVSGSHSGYQSLARARWI